MFKYSDLITMKRVEKTVALMIFIIDAQSFFIIESKKLFVNV